MARHPPPPPAPQLDGAPSARDRARRAQQLAKLRGETELERYDRNLNELLGELRVALPGVQVLFAFLLVAPFNQRFGTVSSFERALYLCALLLTLLSSILLIAPTMIHRLHFQLGAKAYIVHTANRLTIRPVKGRFCRSSRPISVGLRGRSSSRIPGSCAFISVVR